MDPALPDPLAAPAPVDPNAPPLVGGFLGALLPAQAPMADPSVISGIGMPNAALDAAAAAGPPLPTLGPDGQPLPLGANGAPVLPDVGDQIGLAPDGSGPSAGMPAVAPPELAPVPDAISGGRLAPTVHDLTNSGSPAAPFTSRIESHEEQFSGKPLEDPDQEEAIDLLKHADPRDLAELNARHETARQLAAASQQVKAEQANLDWVKANQKMQADAVATANAKADQYVADAKAQAAVKVDPSHYMANRSTGQVVLDLIGAISGGLAAGAVPGGNGVNHYLDVMKDRINNDIDAQTKNIANGWKGIEMEKSAVGENFARTNDLYRAQETARLATWEAVKGQIATQAQLYDPKGTLALSAANAYQQADAQSKAAVYKVNQDLIKNHIEAGKAGLEAQKFVADQEDKARELAEKKREHDQTIGVEYAKLAEAGKTRRDAKGKLYTASDLALLHPGQPTPPPTYAQGPDGKPQIGPDGKPVEVPYMTDKDYGEWIGNENKAEENKGKLQGNTLAVSKGQILSPISGTALTKDGPDGKPVPIVVNDTVADKVNSETAETQKLMDSLSEARRMIANEGVYTSRAEREHVRVLLGSATADWIKSRGANPSSREFTAASEHVMPAIDGVIGHAVDRGKAVEGIDTMLRIAKQDTATDLKGKVGYSGPIDKILLDTSQPAVPVKSTIDGLLEHATDDLRKVATTDPNDVAYLKREDPKGGIKLSSVEATEGRPIDTDIVDKSMKLKIAPSQLKAIDELHDRAVAGDKKAYAALGQIQDDGNTHAMKVYAAGLIRSIEQANMNATTPPEGERSIRSNATARDSNVGAKP